MIGVAKVLDADTALYRLVKERHAVEAFTGEGAKKFGGRWNRKGDAAVYTASTISLALLEMLVQADPLPKYAVIKATLPAGTLIHVVSNSDLPPDWQSPRLADSLRSIGHEWIRSKSSCALCVPSAVVPQENNFILNPLHSDFGNIIIEAPAPIQMDPRLL